MPARTRRVVGRPVLVAITVTAIALGLVSCLPVSPSLSDGQPEHPGWGVAWLIKRGLSMSISLYGNTIEKVAQAGRYLIDVWKSRVAARRSGISARR